MIPTGIVRPMELPEGYQDSLLSTIDIRLGFWDRLRVLLGWQMRIESTVYTECRQGDILNGPSEVAFVSPFYRPKIVFVTQTPEDKVSNNG